MKEKKGIKISIILTLIGVVSLVTGITFAIYENTINAGKSQVIKTGIVNFTLTESTNGLVLDNLQELTDYEGMAQETFYEFTIKNTGNTITDYEISLVDKPNSSYTGTILPPSIDSENGTIVSYHSIFPSGLLYNTFTYASP